MVESSEGQEGSGAPVGLGRAAELWKLLGTAFTDEPTPTAPSTAPLDAELGQLVAKAWYEGTAEDPLRRDAVPVTPEWPASWAVEPLPLGEGVEAMLSPDGDPSTGTRRARLAEMIDQLPTEPPARVGPDDIELEAPVVAPVAVWFWGDDDIYPGRGASASDRPRSVPPRRRGFTR
jgi:hypothetical protein